jgi:hypothetical protein
MISSDNQIVNKYIKNLSLNEKTGDEQIDKIVKNYNSSYILRVMNKINNKVLSGGENQTSQEEPKKDQVKILDIVSETPVNKEEIKVINIVDNNNGVISQVPIEKIVSKPVSKPVSRLVDTVTSSEMPSVLPIEQLSATSSDDLAPKPVSKMVEKVIDSVTSSEMPSVLPIEQLSATSSDVPNIRESETFMKADSVTSSEVPPVIPSEQLSTTSYINHDRNANATTTSTEIPEPVTKSELSDIFIQEKIQAPTIKMSVKDLIEKLKVKSTLLKQKESELKSKETELDNRQKIIVQAEDDSRRKLDEVNKQVDDLKKQKEQLTIEVEGLKNESAKLKDSISEIEVVNNDLVLTETDSKPAQSLLEKIFG